LEIDPIYNIHINGIIHLLKNSPNLPSKFSSNAEPTTYTEHKGNYSIKQKGGGTNELVEWNVLIPISWENKRREKGKQQEKQQLY
jgi:hypothetical protein